ncbi:MAG: SLC13 family permease [Gammaproteobacteria bacterium]|nr:SLC13 family permease [Gammaproteobacteria bacterium]
MTGEIIFVFAVIGVAAVLMASNRVRFDMVALLVVLALMLSGTLSVGEALSGFGSSVVILVAGLLVVGEMLDRTGVARAVGNVILKKGGTNETRLLVVIMIGAALLGSVMSSTAIVAIFIPIVLRVAAETNLNASRMLLPMSYAALISGMLTLIASPPNLVVSEELKAAGFSGFGFFSFTLLGMAVLAVSIFYMVLMGRRLLPEESHETGGPGRVRSIFDVWEDFRLGQRHDTVQISADSPLVGSRLAESQLESRYGVRVLGILRRGRGGEERIASPGPEVELRAGDALLTVGDPLAQQRLVAEQLVSRYPVSDQYAQRWLWELGGAAVLIHPESGLIGKSLREAEFRTHYHLQVLGLRRGKQPIPDFENVELASSDSLFVAGPWSCIHQLQSLTHDFVVLEVPSELAEVVPSYRRMPVALAILVIMVLLSVFDVVPLVAAVIMAVMAAVFTHCITMEDSYRAIHWSSIVLVAGMLPLADALEQTGGTYLIVNTLLDAFGYSEPIVMLTVLFFLTAVLGLVLSNTASAVLVAPIAIAAADVLNVSPYPFALAVMIAASAAFSTPVSTPVVTLIVEPGRYRFVDFLKAGVPLLLLTYGVTALIAPLLFPYHPS